ncbi:STT3 domain-containing protein [Halorhabdus sp. BNX81]|uniref:STT3 domain-containing protein n=1 Tax=Halorhabdus sp. BNX81 TaxID=2980181 RepID=UPI0023DD13ED|nr:STT3 domain-containing protein [Halorhabdus sp. BNX81]WEL20555.1 Dolichol phosphate-mannose mannosyltransferase [Halorhabdus sp. BNX81]
MTDVEATTTELLAEKPDIADDLEELLDVDAAAETWTYEDVPFDSGTFGELVSRGIVEKREGEYTFADREGVRRALGVEQEADKGTARTSPGNRSGGIFEEVSLSDLRVERPVATLGLVGALTLVVLFRVLPWPAVFRGEDVVLSGNDPYYYRYLVHQLIEASGGPVDFSVFASLPEEVAHGEPLMIAMVSWASTLFGGTSAVGGVLAWFPVVSAVLTALLVYVLAVRLTEDRRVGIAAVALLAIMPGHAFRTGLGFADHHAFDYPWLALTALAVVSLVGRDRVDTRNWRTWAWGLALGIGVAGQTLAWDAGPLLVAPLGVFVALAVPSWVRAGRSPAREAAGFLSGLALAALVVLAAHTQWGWHTRVVALAPVLLVGGSVVLVGLGEAARRFEVSARSLLGGEVLIGGVGFAAVWTLFPDFVDELGRGVDFLVSTEGIAETTSIVSGELGSIVGPIFLFGFALFLALPYMGWALWRSSREFAPAWLLVGVYGWWFLLLSVIQIRFAGQLALFAAVFGGLGFVHVAAWVDLGAYPRPFSGSEESGSRGLASGEDVEETDDLEMPERRRALSLLGLGLGVGSLGILNTPIKHSQLLIDESMYEAAQFMREYSAEREWEYPENYVFSQWGRNRVYNWFVNGEARSYGYAQSNFGEFLASENGEEWYERLKDRAGFVVVQEGDMSNGGQAGTIYDQLWSDGFGIETSHYQAVWTDSEDSLQVFTLVPGARLTGPAPANSTVTIAVSAEIGGKSRSITMETDVDADGVYRETVPLPGTYEAEGTSVTVSEDDVQNGTRRSAFHDEGYTQ